MIKLNHVSFSYQNGEANEMQVLSDVSFQASRGECVVLCGKSGCGKTTMLRLVNGLIPHFYAGKLEGNVLVGGQEMQQTPLPQTSRIVGSVFQNPRTQFFHLDTTVAVIGENGAGKSTFSLCLAGLLKHTGTVRIDGKKIAHKKLPEQVYLVMQEAGHQLS